MGTSLDKGQHSDERSLTRGPTNLSHTHLHQIEANLLLDAASGSWRGGSCHDPNPSTFATTQTPRFGNLFDGGGIEVSERP